MLDASLQVQQWNGTPVFTLLLAALVLAVAVGAVTEAVVVVVTVAWT